MSRLRAVRPRRRPARLAAVNARRNQDRPLFGLRRVVKPARYLLRPPPTSISRVLQWAAPTRPGQEGHPMPLPASAAETPRRLFSPIASNYDRPAQGLRVTGADITRPMLLQTAARSGGRVDLVECTAEAPPFADGAFDAVIFSYLLRYVADVPAPLTELARARKPGGTGG